MRRTIPLLALKKNFLVKGSEATGIAVLALVGKHRGGKAMRKFILATLAALVIGTAAFAQPAEARCWWNGY